MKHSMVYWTQWLVNWRLDMLGGSWSRYTIRDFRLIRPEKAITYLFIFIFFYKYGGWDWDDAAR